MLKEQIDSGPGGRIVIMDTITKVDADDRGAIVVTGSHGGVSSGEFALEVPLRAVIFNDAGVGKHDAGIAALAMLQSQHVAAATVAHTSARIGDARDTWECGVISHVNETASTLGLAAGQPLRAVLASLIA